MNQAQYQMVESLLHTLNPHIHQQHKVFNFKMGNQKYADKTSSLSPAYQKQIQAKIDSCLLALKEQGEAEFNKILKEQRDEIIEAFTESMLLPVKVNPLEIQSFVQKYLNAFWQKYRKIEGASPDKIGKKLATEFKSYFVSLLDDDRAKKDYPQEITPTDKEIIVLNQIADIFLETKNKQGKDILLQIEFEAEYNTDKQMDRRVWRYESFVDIEQQKSHERDNQVPERELFTLVFYLRRSPKSSRSKPAVEHIVRTFTTPTSAVSKPVKYTAYHIYQFDIEQIIKLNLPFLFCFVGNMNKATPETLFQYESEIRQMIFGDLTDAQRQAMRMVLANFKQKGYYNMGKDDNIDIFQQMIEVAEMYRGHEAVVRADSLQEGEQMASIKWFLRGRLKFSDLVAEIGEKKAQLVQQNSEDLTPMLEKAMPLEAFLKQLETKGVFWAASLLVTATTDKLSVYW